MRKKKKKEKMITLRGHVSCQKHKNKRFLRRFSFCCVCCWNVNHSRVDILTRIWINLQKTYVTTWTKSECTSTQSVFKAQTNVFGQSDNEHDLQCAETDCLWQRAPTANWTRPHRSLSNALCKIIFWKVELHTNVGIRWTVRSGSKLI